MGSFLNVSLIGNLFLGEVFLDHGIPGLFEGFVHGEGFEGCPGNTLEDGSVIADVEVEALDLVGGVV